MMPFCVAELDDERDRDQDEDYVPSDDERVMDINSNSEDEEEVAVGKRRQSKGHKDLKVRAKASKRATVDTDSASDLSDSLLVSPSAAKKPKKGLKRTKPIKLPVRKTPTRHDVYDNDDEDEDEDDDDDADDDADDAKDVRDHRHISMKSVKEDPRDSQYPFYPRRPKLLDGEQAFNAEHLRGMGELELLQEMIAVLPPLGFRTWDAQANHHDYLRRQFGKVLRYLKQILNRQTTRENASAVAGGAPCANCGGLPQKGEEPDFPKVTDEILRLVSEQASAQSLFSVFNHHIYECHPFCSQIPLETRDDAKAFFNKLDPQYSWRIAALEKLVWDATNRNTDRVCFAENLVRTIFSHSYIEKCSPGGKA